MQNDKPLLSFTFDDFPRSALRQGGTILRSYGIRGTFFVSFGLMGGVGPTGKIFDEDDLHELVQQKHELGCHTYGHCHAWDTAGRDFETSIVRNQKALEKHLPGRLFRTSSYPISCPRPRVKRVSGAYFDCCRGGGQTFNVGSLDLNNVFGFFLEQSRGDFDSIARLIEANNHRRGWLIFVTHDVSDSPTRFGCTPMFFERVVRQAVQSGAEIRTVCNAVQKIREKTC